MAEPRERRKAVRVALSGAQIVRTHEALEAHLLDLGLQGARIAHFGTLRPGALCFVQLPADVGALLLPVRVLWCVICGAEWRSDGERHLRSHSGLGFTTLTAPQQTVPARYLQKARSGDPALRERHPWPAGSSLDQFHPIQGPGEDAARLTGTNGRNGSGTHAEMVVISGGRSPG
jgi:hypothetical protein